MTKLSKHDRIARIERYLHSEGYPCQRDSDGDLLFKREGKSYLVIIQDDDAEYVQLLFPAFWPIESAEERLLVVNAAVNATGNTKAAKVFVIEDNVWASVESFVTSPDQFTAVFERSMAALMVSVQRFARVMRGED